VAVCHKATMVGQRTLRGLPVGIRLPNGALRHSVPGLYPLCLPLIHSALTSTDREPPTRQQPPNKASVQTQGISSKHFQMLTPVLVGMCIPGCTLCMRSMRASGCTHVRWAASWSLWERVKKHAHARSRAPARGVHVSWLPM